MHRLKTDRPEATDLDRRHRVSIIGMGPRGLYCLERLVAEFSAAPLRRGLRIDIFDRLDDFGAGPIYQPDQPEYLLVNIKVGEIDLWEASDPPVAAEGGLDFVTWYARTHPSEASLTGEEYLARAVVGRYLVEGCRRILDQLPAGVDVCSHVGEVVDLDLAAGHHAVTVVSGGRAASVRTDKVILATGHSSVEPGPDGLRWASFADRHSGATYIPFAYPVDERLTAIPARSTVAMLGMGLTFIDAALALTEGRDGSFVADPSGRLTYRPSGHEPRTILPFSRSGLPMSPKSADLPIEACELQFLTRRALSELRGPDRARKLDLDRDVWPLFELEMELRYYRVALHGDPEWHRLDRPGRTAPAMRAALDAYLGARPGLAHFDYRSILDPAAGRYFDTAVDFDRFVGRYMEEQIALARVGQKGSGVKAAIDIWYDARAVLGSVMQYGGFTPESHRRLIEDVFRAFKRVGAGPPIVNMEKLAALHRAGIVDFSFARSPRVSLNEDCGCFELNAAFAEAAAVRAETLLDARYPRVDLAADATPLVRSLRRRGMVRPFENRSQRPGGASYQSGAIDMADPTRFVVDQSGAANADVAVIGIPTEGNLIGNLTMARDAFAGRWANQVMREFELREAGSQPSFVEHVAPYNQERPARSGSAIGGRNDIA
jgi:hypothetical protein